MLIDLASSSNRRFRDPLPATVVLALSTFALAPLPSVARHRPTPPPIFTAIPRPAAAVFRASGESEPGSIPAVVQSAGAATGAGAIPAAAAGHSKPSRRGTAAALATPLQPTRRAGQPHRALPRSAAGVQTLAALDSRTKFPPRPHGLHGAKAPAACSARIAADHLPAVPACSLCSRPCWT